MSLNDDKNTKMKKGNSKIKIIIGILAVIVVLAIVVSVVKSANNKNNDTPPLASETYPYDENGEYDTDAYDESTDTKNCTIDPYEIIQDVIVDINDNKYYIKFDTSYNKTVDGIQLTYKGESYPFGDNEYNTNGLYATLPNGEEIDISYTVDISSFNSTGEVTVTPSESNSYYLTYTEPSATYQASTCDYLSDASMISDSDYDMLKEYALKVYAEASDKTMGGKFYKTYFHMWDGSSISYDEQVGGCLDFMFSYVHEGNRYYEAVGFNQLKITESGEICNLAYVKEKNMKLNDMIDIVDYKSSEYVVVEG